MVVVVDSQQALKTVEVLSMSSPAGPDHLLVVW
jgi:hypothetical protein